LISNVELQPRYATAACRQEKPMTTPSETAMPHDPDDHAVRPRAGRRSRATIAAELQAELDGARVFQLFARKLGPNDVTYVSALALDPRDRVVEVKSTAMELGDALVQLFANLDQATTPDTDPEEA
jgi:hypothetical protein